MSTDQRCDKYGFKLGDHLIVKRTCPIANNIPFGYTHHGIYAGDGLVIENRLDLGITYTELSIFADGSEVKVRNHPFPKFSGLQALKRAKSRLQEKSYNLFTFNCEHFVNWCIEGIETSRQVDNILSKCSKLTPIIDKFPFLKDYVREARQKAQNSHLFTNPLDFETTAHFNPHVQNMQLLADNIAPQRLLQLGTEALLVLLQKFYGKHHGFGTNSHSSRSGMPADVARNIYNILVATNYVARR